MITYPIYRGKRTDNNEWVRGFHVQRNDVRNNDPLFVNIPYHYILAQEEYSNGTFDPEIKWYPVIPETVDTYIGRTDDCGNEIFSGDIVEVVNNVGGRIHKDIIAVEYIQEHAAFVPCCWQLCGISIHSIKVIGNIHDNPELLHKDTQDATTKKLHDLCEEGFRGLQ